LLAALVLVPILILCTKWPSPAKRLEIASASIASKGQSAACALFATASTKFSKLVLEFEDSPPTVDASAALGDATATLDTNGAGKKQIAFGDKVSRSAVSISQLRPRRAFA
jgi:hypothetical protein